MTPSRIILEVKAETARQGMWGGLGRSWENWKPGSKYQGGEASEERERFLMWQVESLVLGSFGA
jgi:hypothetical protein